MGEAERGEGKREEGERGRATISARSNTIATMD